MENFSSRLFRIRSGETGIVLTLGLLLLINSVALQVSGIAAVSGFLEEGGTNQILIVWGVDYLFILLTAALQTLIIDRFNRLTLLKGISFAFMLAFVILRLMFLLRLPGWLNYSVQYILSEQQLVAFPLIFWVLANDVLDLSQSKRLFPLIAGMSFIGKLVGIGIALISPDLFSRLMVAPEEMLIFNVVLYLIVYLLITTGLRNAKIRQTQQRHETVAETLTEGWGFIREVPSFRYLMLALLALTVCDTIIEFRFIVVSKAVFSAPADYQRFYSLYRLGVNLAAFAMQTFFTSRIIDRLTLKNAFLILPLAALGSALWMIGLPGLASGVGGQVLTKLGRDTVNESARKSFEGLVPEERRGRVSAFMDSYLVAGGTIAGCLIAGAVVLVGERFMPDLYFYVYLAVVVLASLFALWSVLRMKTVYDSSLLNWRLKRRQRGASVLDNLEF
jgi:AAA family ATP:ADP antiporter